MLVDIQPMDSFSSGYKDAYLKIKVAPDGDIISKGICLGNIKKDCLIERVFEVKWKEQK